MPQIQGYDATVEAAKRALEAAQNALSRDVGQAIGTAGWSFLRDKCDVIALVDVVKRARQPAGLCLQVTRCCRQGPRPTAAAWPSAEVERRHDRLGKCRTAGRWRPRHRDLAFPICVSDPIGLNGHC